MWWVYFSSLHSYPRGYVSPMDALLQQRDKDVWVRNPREAQQQSGHLHAASNWAETSLLSHAFCSHAWILADGAKLSWLFTHYWTSQWLSPDLSSMEGGWKLFCLYKLFKCMLRLNMGKVKNKTKHEVRGCTSPRSEPKSRIQTAWKAPEFFLHWLCVMS